MIQSVKKELAAAGEVYSFAELCRMASHETIKSIVPCNDDVFLAPESMTEAVKAYLRESGQEVPETAGALAAVIYNSLAQCYKETVEELEAITGRTYQAVNIVGGGSNAEYLNQLTAKATGKTVYAVWRGNRHRQSSGSDDQSWRIPGAYGSESGGLQLF